ncbi:MAG: MFS transporter [Pirellulales bacterium]|nr:MFS transporter [Pirellulales bacterium]
MQRWIQLALLAVSQLLAMALWFSASAVGDQLKGAWQLDRGQQAWLTMSVQFGFVVGALGSAILNLSDRWSPQRLIAIAAFCGAMCNLVIPLLISDAVAQTTTGFVAVIGLRFTTGLMLAGVYPPAMKVVATWFKSGRGLAIGIVVGALTVGSASPHLFKAFAMESRQQQVDQSDAISRDVTVAGAMNWRTVLITASTTATVAAVVTLLFVRTGPLLPARSPFDVGYALRAWKNVAVRRANFGYLGHMWELYAMWASAPLFVAGVCSEAGWSRQAALGVAFATVAIGGVGSVLAGAFADQFGRCRTTIASMAVSGSCALLVSVVPQTPWLISGVCLIWGLTIVADSAQFSTAVSELCDQAYVGTALTLQTCAGFLLSAVTIRAVPWLQETTGNGVAFGILAVGPMFGIWHMARLRGMPEAVQMASGAR